jgi:hypothetical protein
VWHFYHVMFDPEVYPLNLECWDGRVSKEWQKEEHPLDYSDQAEIPRVVLAENATRTQASEIVAESKDQSADANNSPPPVTR